MIRNLLLILLFCLPAPASAWWDYGHETIAELAMLEAKPQTRAAVAALLRQSPRLGTPRCPARTIRQAARWADCIKAMRDRFGHTDSWHYQNADVCRPFDLGTACADGDCVSAQIERNARRLADRRLPARERLEALLFVIHFVGDLHQPLHAGDRADRGGNDFRLDYGVIPNTNLHLVWDGYVAERGITEPPAGAQAIRAGIPAGNRAALRHGTVVDWSRESWQIARDRGYGLLLGDPCAPLPEHSPVMTEAMVQQLVPVVRLQVARAGIRLARLLDEALDPRG